MSDAHKPALVPLRERREQVIQWLSEQFSQDVLDMDEFDKRVDLAHQATTIEALERLTQDLPPMEASAAQPAQALVPARAAVPAVAAGLPRPPRKRMMAILGGIERKGQWLVPQKLRATTFMGGIVLDFRDAILPPGITELHINAVMGGVEIIVPPHVAVQADGFAILGGFADMHRAPTNPDPETPLLVISGMAVMGGVEISTRLPNESERQARRRAREERRQLRKTGRGQLGDGG